MTHLFAIDLRRHRFSDSQIAQARVAQPDALLSRTLDGFDILLDIAFGAAMVGYVLVAITEGTQV